MAGRGSRAKTPNSSIVVYLYQSDGITAMNPAPTDVTIKVGKALPAYRLSFYRRSSQRGNSSPQTARFHPASEVN
jgi:hypothetical protein